MNIPYNNYKTQLCKFWEKEGKCKFNKNCSYAHGDHELRKPYEAMPKDVSSAYQKTLASANAQYDPENAHPLSNDTNAPRETNLQRS